MKRILFFLLVSLFAYSFIYAQGIEFISLSCHGKIGIIRGNNEVGLKVENMIYDNDIININKGSSLNLVYKDGHTLYIDSPGKFTVKKLVELVQKNNTSVNRKFTNFVLAEFVKSENDLNNMHTLGEVVRNGITTIEYAFPPNTNYMDSVITFNWYPSSNNSYIFKLIGKSNVTIYIKDCMDTSVTLNLKQLGLRRGIEYKWLLYQKNNIKLVPDTNKFVWLPESEVYLIKDSVNSLLNDLTDIDTTMKQIIIASFYSQKKLYVNMLNAYEKAIDLDPLNNNNRKLLSIAFYKLGLIRKSLEINSQIQ